MTERPLRPGDGIVSTSTGRFYFIKALVERGPNGHGKDPREVVGYAIELSDGELLTIYHGKYRRATFMEYMFRPGGFGKTTIVFWILVHGFGLWGIVWAFTETPWALLALMAPAGLWLGTWKNWRGRWV